MNNEYAFDVNEEQAQALDTTVSVALKASAGSGKTRVLINRFTKLILENPTLKLDQLVAITFTKKAAIEMKKRIREELDKWIESIKKSSLSEAMRLHNIKEELTHARIGTIHSFCSTLIRNHYSVVGIDPKFKVIEEVDQQLILEKMINEAFNTYVDTDLGEANINEVLKEKSVDFLLNKLPSSIIELYLKIRELGLSVVEVQSLTKLGNDNYQDLIFNLLSYLNQEYSAYKTRENVLDYNDLELLAAELLKNDSISQYYKNYFVEVMVDEFQDVNPLQDTIIQAIGSRLFIVGDYKQSIYGFRGSDYRIFLEAIKRIKNNGRELTLSSCYRSHPVLIDGINALFEGLLSPYDPLNPKKERDDINPRMHLITWTKDKKSTDGGTRRWDAVKDKLGNDEGAEETLKKALSLPIKSTTHFDAERHQAQIVVKTIQKQRELKIPYQDMVILLKSRAILEAIELELNHSGIPYNVLGGLGFWNRYEINDILALFQWIHQNGNRLMLYIAMRSPIFGFSDNFLMAFAEYEKQQQELSLIETVEMFSKESHSLDNETAYKLNRLLVLLKHFIQFKHTANSLELFDEIISRTQYDLDLLASPNGEKKFRNLEKLREIVYGFNENVFYQSKDLPGYIKQLKELEINQGEAYFDQEESDAVKIMTIHASKGLEFETVIIPGLHKTVDFFIKHKMPEFIVDVNHGVLVGECADDRTISLFNEAKERLRKDTLDESRRLLYVAITRAKQNVFLIGEEPDKGVEGDLYKQNSFIKQLKWALQSFQAPSWISQVDSKEYVGDLENTQNKSLDTHKMQMTEKLMDYLNGRSFNDFVMPNDSVSYTSTETIKGVLSFSAWKSYEACPRKYYFENLMRFSLESPTNVVHNLEEPMMDRASIGTVFHEYIESTNHGEWNSEQLIQHFDQFSKEKRLSEKVCDIITPLIQGFAIIEKEKEETEHYKGLVGCYSELPFRVALTDRLTFKGFIDRVDVFDLDGQLVVDVIVYKTNVILDESALVEKVEAYKSQLIMYAWALSQMSLYEGKKPSIRTLSLYFLDDKQEITLEFDPLQAEQIKERIIKSAPLLLGGGSFQLHEPKYGNVCSFCGVGSHCKAFNEY